MTDGLSNRGEGRLDLRALDAADIPARNDAVIAAVLARVDARSANIALLLRTQRRMLAVAAVRAAIAVATVAHTPNRTNAAPANDPIAQWAQSGHVPTNGELLAAYQGYHP